ncbi:MAG: fimbrillin family protein [Muribaculaceae bacterium]|nr:fimbrillin family protein [Muribaculaceae bacterium]
MKKVLFGAMAALTLVACSNDEVTDVTKSKEIKFSVSTGNAETRAADSYCSNNLPASFKVWANVDGKNYIEGETYNEDGGNYVVDGANLRYWPASNIDFHAVVNENGSPSWDAAAGQLSFTGYTVDTDVAQQKDFLYAVAANCSKPASGVQDLNFRHALAQVMFKGKCENSKIYVEISGVQICKIKNVGDFALPTLSTSTQNINHGPTGWDTPLESGNYGVWSNLSGSVTNAVSFEATALTNAGVNLTYTTDDHATSNIIYMVPQTLTPWLASNGGTKPADQNGSYFLLTAKIWNVAGGSVDKANDVVIYDGQIAIPTDARVFEGGKRYVYTFIFTAGGNGGWTPDPVTPVLTPVKFTVTVDDFVEETNKDIETPNA